MYAMVTRQRCLSPNQLGSVQTENPDLGGRLPHGHFNAATDKNIGRARRRGGGGGGTDQGGAGRAKRPSIWVNVVLSLHLGSTFVQRLKVMSSMANYPMAVVELPPGAL
jgi:hypothetical protein